MRLNIGSLDLSEDTVNWLKVRSLLSDWSVRATVGKVLEREVSKSKVKWLNELKLAAAARDMSVTELWELLLMDGSVLPPPTNNAAGLEAFIEQVDQGEVYKGD